MRELVIHLLGHFEIEVDGAQVDEQRWSRKKAKVLLKVLALAPNRKMQREQLLSILWPEMETEAAINNLHKVIHAARRALEPEMTPAASRFLITKDQFVALADETVWIDADEFERLAAEAVKSGSSDLLKRAMELYRGDLLEEDLYEDWATMRRERLRLLYQRVLEKLSANLEAVRDEHAIDILNRLLAMNIANEEAHRRLMRMYSAMGQRHLALQQYRICADALNKELDVLPEPATTQLYESLLVGAATAEPAPVAHKEAAVAPVEAAAPPAQRPAWILWLLAASAVVALAYFIAEYTPLFQHKPAQIPSLAILPLRRESDKGQLDAMADGITEELINSISRMAGIRVMARATVFAYKGRLDAREIGRELKVSTVLSGFLRQEGDMTSIGVELIDIEDGARLWARKYSVTMQNLASLQRLLATELAAALERKLTGRQAVQPVRKVTDDAAAYRLYLTGRSYANQRTSPGIRKSLEYYQQAIGRDPAYGLAYAGLADSYGLLGWEDGLPADYYSKARAAAEKALELDPSLAEAQTSLAMVSALYDWNWPVAEAQFRRAIELNSGYATAHHWYGVHLGAMGRFEESRRELTAARDLDPLSPIVNLNLGYPAYYERQFPQALAIYRQVLALNQNFAPAHEDSMIVSSLMGDTAAATSEAIQFLRYSGQTELADLVERASGQGGLEAALKVWLGAVEKRAGVEYVSPMIPARLAATLRDREKCLLWLDRAWQQRSPQLVYLAVDPVYDSLRAEGRFQQLLKRIGLPSR